MRVHFKSDTVSALARIALVSPRSLSARAVEHLACTGGASPRREGGGCGRRRAGAVKGVGATGVCAVRRRRRWLNCTHLQRQRMSISARAHSVSFATERLSAPSSQSHRSFVAVLAQRVADHVIPFVRVHS
jgi:hypothetical protein